MRALKENTDEIGIRCYGHSSNVARGKRKMLEEDALIPPVLKSDESSKARLARPGANHLSVVGLDDASHQTCFFYAAWVTGLGQLQAHPLATGMAQRRDGQLAGIRLNYKAE